MLCFRIASASVRLPHEETGVHTESSVRRHRTKRRAIGAWPPQLRPKAVASRARYVGSAEHKAYPSPAGPPALRSDATPCDPKISFDAIQAALRKAINRRCVSAAFEQDFPKYAWGWIDGRLYEARHINGPAGTYKGYEIEETEYPEDPENRLNWESA